MRTCAASRHRLPLPVTPSPIVERGMLRAHRYTLARGEPCRGQDSDRRCIDVRRGKREARRERKEDKSLSLSSTFSRRAMNYASPPISNWLASCARTRALAASRSVDSSGSRKNGPYTRSGPCTKTECCNGSGRLMARYIRDLPAEYFQRL